MRKTMMRVGLGRDIHPLVPGRRFLLGGIEIPSDKGELGHSDADVLTHAVIDSLLGAAGLNDIGGLFPPQDPAWKDADSLMLLRRAYALVRDSGWQITNLDCVVIAETQKVLPYRDKICASLAEVMGIKKEQVFVKGKTNEGLGPVGKGEAVEALAVCLLEK